MGQLNHTLRKVCLSVIFGHHLEKFVMTTGKHAIRRHSREHSLHGVSRRCSHFTAAILYDSRGFRGRAILKKSRDWRLLPVCVPDSLGLHVFHVGIWKGQGGHVFHGAALHVSAVI